MASYLKANDLELSVRDRQFLFQCRTCDIEAKANRTWRHDQIFCVSCKDPSKIETGKHILECKVLCDQNDLIMYLPEYKDLYSLEVQEQIYTSRIIHENMQIRKQYLKSSN